MIFDRKKIKLIKEKIELIKAQAEQEGRFSLFHTKCAEDIFKTLKNYKEYNYYYNLLYEKDKKCNIPYNLGVSLELLLKTNIVFIHRTNLYYEDNINGIPNNEKLYSAMKDGLKNFGHTNAYGGSAIIEGYPSITLTMTPLGDIAGYINLISSYKNDNTIVLAAFPKEIIDKEGNLLNGATYETIYNMVGGTPAVKPEYMCGAFIKNDKSWDFFTRDEITNGLSKTK